MKKIICALLLLLLTPAVLWAACTGSSPNWTSTPDRTSVNSCVSQASPGDRIDVTAGDGSETWTSGLWITKGLHIIGPGRDNLTITYTGTGVFLVYDPSNRPANIPFRFNGFTVVASNAAGKLIELGHLLNPTEIQTTGIKQTNIRIDNNRFTSNASTSITNNYWYVHGGMFGVIDNNIFEGGWYAGRFDIDYGCYVWNYWGTYPGMLAHTTLGHGDNLYFEDNTISMTDKGQGTLVTSTQFGGRWAFRYNNISAQNGQPIFDFHGNAYAEQMASSQIAELYGNSITGGGTFTDMRGSRSFIFYNQLPSALTMKARQDWFPEQTPGTLCGSSILHNAITGEAQWVSDTYHWKNLTTSGATIATIREQGNSGYDGTLPVAGVDFFTDNTSPSITCGTLANRPASGTTGQGYWATNQSCSSTSGMVGVNPSSPISGTLYKWSGGTWVAYYTPYTYPHPLRSPVTPDDVAPIVNWVSPTAGSTVACTSGSNPMIITEQAGSNEAATVKRGASNVVYDSLTSIFSTSGGYTHTQEVSRACGASYTVYVAGMDASGNKSATAGYTYTIGAAEPETPVFIDGTKYGENSAATVQGVCTDTYLNDEEADTAKHLSTSVGFWTGASGASHTTLFKFDLSSIPTSATVTAAKLYLSLTSYGGDATYEVTAHKVTGKAAIVSQATWNSAATSLAWTAAGGLSDVAASESTEVVGTDLTWYEWTLTTMVGQWIATPATNYGVLLASDQTVNTATENSYRYFASSNKADATLRPILVVDFDTPDPGTPGESAKTINLTGGTLTISPSGGSLTITW